MQDAGNHLYSALNAVSRIDVDYEFQTGTEVTKVGFLLFLVKLKNLIF